MPKSRLSQQDIDELMETHLGYVEHEWPSPAERDRLTRRVEKQNALAWFWLTVSVLIVAGVIAMLMERAADVAACASSMLVAGTCP